MSRAITYLVILILLAVLAIAPRQDDGGGEPGPILVEGYVYRERTLQRFRLLFEDEGWSLAEPPRNAQGMLQATHEKTGLTFVLIPAGSFQMGSPVGEEGREDDEVLHPVTIRRPFLLCETECAQAAWEKGGGKDFAFFEACFKGADRPIESVSWPECRRWCTRNGLRLPSESEWEYACRAGTRTRFSWGNDWDPSKCVAETDLVSAEGERVEYYRMRGLPVNATVPVGKFPPNAWGLFDMHGNVWEWCHDWYGPYSEAPADGSPRKAQGGCSGRVTRSGCWGTAARNCRSAVRFYLEPSTGHSKAGGFRPAADLPQ